MVAAALVVAPMATAGASAKDKKPADTVVVGSVGALEEATSEANDTKYWNNRYSEFDAQCYKHEGKDMSNSHGRLTDGGLTVTLNEYEDAWWGDAWVALIVKAGTLNNVVVHPEAEVAYASPTNPGGNQAKVSHWIVCKGDLAEVQEPELVEPWLTHTDPTCEAAGSVTKSDEVDWTSRAGESESTFWTAKPKPGTEFDEEAQDEWHVPDLDQLSPEDERCLPTGEPDQPEPDVEYGQWQDGAWDCGDTTVVQTRTVTTTQLDESGAPVGEPDVAIEERQRELTAEELAENCPLLPGEITSVCVGDVPFLGYEVSLPEGYEADSENPVTITFVNPDGENYVVEDQPLSGALLWPGASNGEPKMWPGWELLNGEYVKTTGNFDWTRNGITVRFDVNPTYETEVEYPAATALCANPPVGGGDDPTGTPASSDAETLPATGGGLSPMFVVAGGAALVAGIAAVAFAAHRRRQADMK
ncbi:hypothetical protein ACFT30_13310 [Microbacterium ureisolvens]|uniref:hypothetical protein n=1 Tax=Microbacterium ureisolvens TaxID=2781186 RepID=UPI0036428E8C